MSHSDFTAAILEAEVIVKHTDNGHIYHFPVLADGTVSLHGSRIEANPRADSEANRYLFEALDAAQMAFGPSHV
jgi:hypothetical protein